MDVILSLLLNQNLLFFEVKIIIPGDIFRVNKGLFINDMSLTSSLEGQGGEIPNFLRDICSQNVSEGCQGTFQHYVWGCSIRATCKVYLLHFYLAFLPPLHIYKLMLY